jgi:hypothetical protein
LVGAPSDGGAPAAGGLAGGRFIEERAGDGGTGASRSNVCGSPRR